MDNKEVLEKLEKVEKELSNIENMFKKLLISLYPNCIGQQDVYYITNDKEKVE